MLSVFKNELIDNIHGMTGSLQPGTFAASSQNPVDGLKACPAPQL